MDTSKWFVWLHNHRALVGFAHRKWIRYPHKPPIAYMCTHISMRLYNLSHRRVGCPGHGTEECKLRHESEHTIYKVLHGIPLTEVDDER